MVERRGNKKTASRVELFVVRGKLGDLSVFWKVSQSTRKAQIEKRRV